MATIGVEYGMKMVLLAADGTRAVFNDPTDVDYVGILSPESSGLDGAEVREDSAERVESDGAIFGSFYAGKRPIVLTGTIRATDPISRNTKVRKLKRAANALRSYSTLSWTPQGGEEVFVNVKLQQPVRITGGNTKQFQVALVAPDSRLLSVAQKTAEVTAGSLSEEFLTYSPEALKEDGGSAKVWTNKENAKAEDAVYATAALSGAANYSHYLYFGLPGATRTALNALPFGTQVTNVEVSVKRKASASPGVVDSGAYLRLINSSGSIASLNKASATAWPTGAAVASYGGALLSKWGLTPFFVSEISGESKPGVFNDLYFEFAAQWVSGTPTAEIDSFKVQINYVKPITTEIENVGDVLAPGKIEVTGPITNPTIENAKTKERFVYVGTIAAGETIIIDTEAKTVKNQLGVNKFAGVEFPADWIQIEPGKNSFSLSGISTSGATKLKVVYRNGWS